MNKLHPIAPLARAKQMLGVSYSKLCHVCRTLTARTPIFNRTVGVCVSSPTGRQGQCGVDAPSLSHIVKGAELDGVLGRG